MSQKNNGGPAFPLPEIKTYTSKYDGMSFRDYAAIHADVSNVEFGSPENLAEFVGVPMDQLPDTNDMEGILNLAVKAVAKMRYMLADAMIAERNKEPNA